MLFLLPWLSLFWYLVKSDKSLQAVFENGALISNVKDGIHACAMALPMHEWTQDLWNYFHKNKVLPFGVTGAKRSTDNFNEASFFCQRPKDAPLFIMDTPFFYPHWKRGPYRIRCPSSGWLVLLEGATDFYNDQVLCLESAFTISIQVARGTVRCHEWLLFEEPFPDIIVAWTTRPDERGEPVEAIASWFDITQLRGRNRDQSFRSDRRARVTGTATRVNLDNASYKVCVQANFGSDVNFHLGAIFDEDSLES